MPKRLPTSLSIKSACLLTALSLLGTAGNAARAQQNCLPVHGLSFEKVDSYQLLAVRDGRNIAFISSCGRLPDRLGVFRFFSQNLCLHGAENRFHIDGQLNFVCKIETFANVR